MVIAVVVMQSLDHDPLILLADVARIMRTRADQHARAHGMTRAQWVILARLEKQPGLSQSELATVCEVEPITIARLIDRLEARGVVERRGDPSDRRIKRLFLTAAASPILNEITDYRREINLQLAAGLDKASYDALINALLRIKTNLVTRDVTATRAVPAE